MSLDFNYCSMIDLVKILLACCCALGVQGRLPEQIAPLAGNHGLHNQELTPRRIQRIQRMDPDVLIGKNPDEKTAVLFLGDMLCAYYTRTGDVTGMIRFCNTKAGKENTGGSKTKLSEKDLPQVKCDFCKTLAVEEKTVENSELPQFVTNEFHTLSSKLVSSVSSFALKKSSGRMLVLYIKDKNVDNMKEMY
ncbi:hypothetical protein KUTeg_001822 [Tegillarca granosa]|uniref:Uncharacterized protein n=1 Tax=Tegillarca granosa TaxID=220873 RepID=A0ABQ9FWV6_TEGGR|nr:hypothetical protein KUTeg_001822 [Tegillarca granosa]